MPLDAFERWYKRGPKLSNCQFDSTSKSVRLLVNMKIAILFALVCLSGCAIAQQTCEQDCKVFANVNISVVNGAGGVTVVRVKNMVDFVVLIKGDFAFVVKGRLSILINRGINTKGSYSGGFVLSISGSKAKLLKEIQADIELLFKYQVDVAYKNIDEKLQKTKELGFHFSYLRTVKSSTEIKYTELITGDADAPVDLESGFSVFFTTTVDISIEYGSGSINVFSLVAGVVVETKSDYEAAIALGRVFGAIGVSTEAEVDATLTIALNLAVKKDFDGLFKLRSIIEIMGKLSTDIVIADIKSKTVSIKGISSTTVITVTYWKKYYRLEYYVEGQKGSRVSFLLNLEAVSTHYIGVVSAIGYNLHIKAGVYAITCRDTDVSFATDYESKKVLFYYGETEVDFRAKFTLLTKTSIDAGIEFSNILELYATKTQAEVVAGLQKALSVSSSAAIQVQTSFEFMFKFSKTTSILFVSRRVLQVRTCLEVCMQKSDKLSTQIQASYGAAIHVFCGSIEAGLSALGSLAAQASFSASFSLAFGFGLSF